MWDAEEGRGEGTTGSRAERDERSYSVKGRIAAAYLGSRKGGLA